MSISLKADGGLGPGNFQDYKFLMEGFGILTLRPAPPSQPYHMPSAPRGKSEIPIPRESPRALRLGEAWPGIQCYLRTVL